jgi:isoleucyl-tRNA synthetase
VNARITAAFEAEGADAWYAEGAKERFLGNLVNAQDYEQVFDILDVWFDSGSTHAFVLRDREDGSEDGLADLYLRAPTSTAAGSTPRCSRPAAPAAARPTGAS